MPGKQAKILSKSNIDDLLQLAQRGRYPERDRLIFLLSIRAGLRAAEIANLTWEMVLTPEGEIGPTIELQNWAAKKRSGRKIPVHGELRAALITNMSQRMSRAHVITSERGDRIKPQSIVNLFAAAYQKLGFAGCSSHSGRRTFITNAARKVHLAGGSLRDVQLLAGHRSIQTTQQYIDGDSEVQRKLIDLL